MSDQTDTPRTIADLERELDHAIASRDAEFEAHRLTKLEVARAEAERDEARRGVEELQSQLRLCEEHAGTMAKDFDASIAVVQSDRDRLAAEKERLETLVDIHRAGTRQHAERMAALERERDELRDFIASKDKQLQAAGVGCIEELISRRDALRTQLKEAREQLEDWLIGGECFCSDYTAARGPCSFCKTVGLLKGGDATNERKDTNARSVTGASEVPSSLSAEPKTEKDRRIYYQTIVYDVCNLLDKANGKRPGEGIVCGTVDDPSQEVQETLSAALAQIERLRGGLNELLAAQHEYDTAISVREQSHGTDGDTLVAIVKRCRLARQRLRNSEEAARAALGQEPVAP